MPNWLIWTLSASVSGVFIIDLCEAIFRCGCRSWWAGASTMCNVHRHGVKHCPFCASGTEAFLALLAIVIAVQGYLSFRPWPASTRLAASVIAFPVVAGIEALVLGLFSGYWK